MKENAIELLFSILRSVFHDNEMSDADKKLITDESLKEIVKLASKHDIEHLIALGVLKSELTGSELKPQLQQLVFQAVNRYEKINYEINRVCEALENAKIQFLPLKGSVIRKYYPEPWMRTSCDIDILVHEKDLKYAVTYLVASLGYTEHEQNSHDVSLYSSSGIHLELHYDLVEEGWANSSSDVLQDVWNYVLPKKDYKYWTEMPNDTFYFYHIAHMAKHLQQGGCGIRTFIDLWILNNVFLDNKESREKMLEAGGLLKFYKTASRLASAWLDNNTLDPLCRKLQNYILSGGVYGTNENLILVQQQKKGGKFRYALSKIIIPYDTIKFHYPILQKHRWLTPIMQVRRWFKLIFCGHAKRSMRELSYNSKVTKSQAEEMKTFLDEIGL